MSARRGAALLLGIVVAASPAAASYTNYEVAHVHPIALTASGTRLLAINTPDARLEVFAVAPDGTLTPERSIPVGLEPVSVTVRTASEAWVVNRLSDSVSIVDFVAGTTTRTLRVGDEPADVAFAGGKAFVAAGKEDAVKVYDLANLGLAPTVVPLFSRDIRALAVAPGGTKVYAVPLRSGNQTTSVHAVIAFRNDAALDPVRMTELGLVTMRCEGAPPPPYPPLPPGIVRNPALTDPPNGVPKVPLIVKWNLATQHWEDDAGQDWTHCLPFRLPDRDLFIIDAATLAVTPVAHLGTTLFDVSVNPANGRVYVPNTDARNHVRFEHPLGLRGYVVENRLSIVDPAAGNAVTRVELNAHIDRESDPATNLAEREASVSQPGMMAWQQNGARAWLTAIGSRKLFRIDGTCLQAPCIAGADRAAPDAVVVGEGPTGVALLEGAQRAYVMLRFSNSIAVVDTTAMAKVGEIPLHDPSPPEVRDGRRLLYDGIDGSGHGDAACSSCHISGDLDGLAWDLGDPEGELASYTNPNNNVRFVDADAATQSSLTCSPFGPNACADHAGFDPQKGPMTTQTLRGMLEPLHWRGDKPTFLDFNSTFVTLMGTADLGPIGSPAGLSAANMDLFRRYALGIRYQPNPNRTVLDTVPSMQFPVPSTPYSGNPASGETMFSTIPARSTGVFCVACHELPFGAAGGAEGGVAPQMPTAPAASGLHSGTVDSSLHSDIEIPHLRNIYDKFGPQYGTLQNPPDRKTGFGYTNEGAVPDVGTFLSQRTFILTSAQVRDVTAFLFFFPTGTKPAVGRQLTFPPGTPPTGSSNDENILQVLKVLGDGSSSTRHCELTATALDGGRMRAWRYGNGLWTPDVAGEPAVLTSALRSGADGPINFLCAPLGSGARLGGDRDEDAVRDGDDCGPADAEAWSPAAAVGDLVLAAGVPTSLAWADQAPVSGPGVRYDVARGTLSALRSQGLDLATGCVEGDLATPAYDDASPPPASRDGYFYLVRSRNSCASPGFGRAAIDDLACLP